MDNFDKELDEMMDEFDFKPITEGLGFHHSLADKSKIKIKLKSQQKSLENNLAKRAENLKSNFGELDTEHVQHMGELSAFYDSTIKEVEPLVKEEQVSLIREVAMSLRFGAWAVDMAIIVSMLVITIFSVLFTADMPLDIFSPYMVSSDLLLSFSVIFSMFYIFYFSFLERTQHSTLGKRLFNLKVIGMRSNITLFNTFPRAILSLFSLFTLGLFSLLSLQDSLTDTKVISR